MSHTRETGPGLDLPQPARGCPWNPDVCALLCGGPRKEACAWPTSRVSACVPLYGEFFSCVLGARVMRGHVGSCQEEGCVLSYMCQRPDSHFHLFLRDPMGKEVRYSVLNVIIRQGRGVSSDRLSFSVKNSLSFINKLQCFFTKITVCLLTNPFSSLGGKKIVSLSFAFLASSSNPC